MWKSVLDMSLLKILSNSEEKDDSNKHSLIHLTLHNQDNLGFQTVLILNDARIITTNLILLIIIFIWWQPFLFSINECKIYLSKKHWYNIMHLY